MYLIEQKYAKPFLKWAGGKTQLLQKFSDYFPQELKNGKIENYYEPFLGSGAVFFFIKQNYPIKKAFLTDINEELILTFNVVKSDVTELIEELKSIKEKYISLKQNEQELFFYHIRDTYNQNKTNIDFNNYSPKWISRAAQMIFLNKTCFNGLFRQNIKGEFNVPWGKYKNPKICDKENLKQVNLALKNTEILCGDFSESSKYITKNSLVYFDPPYRPINPTSSFTSYSKENFTEEDQVRLADYFREIDKKGAYQILSNSDPKNENSKDDFFDNLYKGFNIERVNAKRVINCDPNKRGEIKELIITNFKSTEVNE